MREIKFRAWKKSENKFVSWYELCEDPVDMANALQGYKYETIEQYTGLKDKNGKEIYEGDVVKQAEYICKIIFDIGGFCFESDNFYDRTCLHLLASDTKNWGIIGNIHEAPK